MVTSIDYTTTYHVPFMFLQIFYQYAETLHPRYMLYGVDTLLNICEPAITTRSLLSLSDFSDHKFSSISAKPFYHTLDPLPDGRSIYPKCTHPFLSTCIRLRHCDYYHKITMAYPLLPCATLLLTKTQQASLSARISLASPPTKWLSP